MKLSVNRVLRSKATSKQQETHASPVPLNIENMHFAADISKEMLLGRLPALGQAAKGYPWPADRLEPFPLICLQPNASFHFTSALVFTDFAISLQTYRKK